MKETGRIAEGEDPLKGLEVKVRESIHLQHQMGDGVTVNISSSKSKKGTGVEDTVKALVTEREDLGVIMG